MTDVGSPAKGQLTFKGRKRGGEAAERGGKPEGKSDAVVVAAAPVAKKPRVSAQPSVAAAFLAAAAAAASGGGRRSARHSGADAAAALPAPAVEQPQRASHARAPADAEECASPEADAPCTQPLGAEAAPAAARGCAAGASAAAHAALAHRAASAAQPGIVYEREVRGGRAATPRGRCRVSTARCSVFPLPWCLRLLRRAHSLADARSRAPQTLSDSEEDDESGMPSAVRLSHRRSCLLAPV
jgi:hypothetical protein